LKSARRIRIYVSEDERYGGKPLFKAILIAAWESGLAEATAVKGYIGYSLTAPRISTVLIMDLAINLPVVVDIVGDEERIHGFLAFLKRAVGTGIVICSDVDSEQITVDETPG